MKPLSSKDCSAVENENDADFFQHFQRNFAAKIVYRYPATYSILLNYLKILLPLLITEILRNMKMVNGVFGQDDGLDVFHISQKKAKMSF